MLASEKKHLKCDVMVSTSGPEAVIHGITFSWPRLIKSICVMYLQLKFANISQVPDVIFHHLYNLNYSAELN